MLFAGVIYTCFPTEYILSGRDFGLYAVNAAHISDTGSWFYEEDPILAAKLPGISLSYPGLYTAYESKYLDEQSSQKAGQLIPQFLPMFPALAAAAYDLFGIPGLLRLSGVLAIMAMLSIYFFVKRHFGFLTAFIAFSFLAVNPAEILNARLTETEILSQLLFFTSLYLFSSSWQSNSKLYAALGGLLLGLGALCRMDAYMYGVGLYLFLLYPIFCKRERLTISLIYAGVLTVSAAAIFIFSIEQLSPIYFWESIDPGFGSANLAKAIALNLALIILALLSLLISSIIGAFKRDYLILLLDKKYTKYIIGAVFILAFLSAYFIRPLLLEPDPPRYLEYFSYNSMVEFCWYTSFIAIIFAIAGIISIIEAGNKERESLFLFLSICLASTVIYLYNPSITPDHFWASRRWVTVNIPFIMILASVGIIYLVGCLSRRYDKKFARNLGILFVAAIAAYSFYQSKLFIFRTMLKDYSKQYQQAADALDDDAIYLTTNARIVAPLRFIWKKPVYFLRREFKYSDLLKIQEILGKKVSLLDGFAYNKVEKRFLLSGLYPEQRRNGYPERTFQWNEAVMIGELIDLTSFQGALDIPLYTMRSQPIGGGNLVYGPHMQLPKGLYEIKYNFKVYNSSINTKASFIVAADGDRVELAREDRQMLIFLNSAEPSSVKLSFELVEEAEGINFLLVIPEELSIALTSLELSRAADR
ncbi:MAG: glycosyltransferase family 39 protein [Deferribacteraceae bacterium]|nr:glycosyltransferase family 39 protein [Deferribacteraceae bacterium]